MNTVMRNKQPRVSFLHCEELHALTNKKKGFIFGVLFFCKFIFGSFQADLFGPWGEGGRRGRSHCNVLYLVENQT